MCIHIQDFSYKVCIFGDGGVGKTTLINRYLTGVFKSDSKMTIGVDFHIKLVEVEGKKVKLQIWDFAGEKRFKFLLPSYAIGSSGGIFMFDISRYSSLLKLGDWLSVFKTGAMRDQGEVPLIMVGGKLDLEYKRAIIKNDAEEMAKSNNFYDLIECSSKTGENVEFIFQKIARIMMEKEGVL